MTDEFDINPDAPVDVQVLRDATIGIKTLTHDLMASKQEEARVIQESMANGGPSGTVEAIRNIMQNEGMGMRELSKLSGIKRHTLKRMLDGEADIPMQDSIVIIEVLQQKFPKLDW